MRGLAEGLRVWRNRTTIRKQLSLLVGLAVGLAIALQIVYTYATQTHANETQQVEALTRVLTLEGQRLDEYVEELHTFSLQLRSNAEFMTIAGQTAPLSYGQKQDVEAALKAAFYARGDLVGIELYLTRQLQCYAMENEQRKVRLTENADAAALSDYATFTARPAFYSMAPDPAGLLRFTRAIIDAPRTTPLAVVRFTVDAGALQALENNHRSMQESVCLFGTGGERYAVPRGLAEAEIASLEAGMQSKGGSFTTLIDGKPNLCVAAGRGSAGFVLVGFKPMTVVNAALIATRNGSIAIGLIALAVTVLLTEAFIRFATEPLTRLAHWLRRAGAGNFKAMAKLEGSYEIIGLSEDVNRMMGDIDGLIERTYVATLNERTAQLAALEAQINPHFLFNTLQAIGSEALTRGQLELYRMVTALAALLRYSIRGGNLATLETELGYVGKYLSLQKARFGDRLTYHIHADPALVPLNVPKLGVLSLVENSIVHGLSDQMEPVHIEIGAAIEGENAQLTVSDNGCGIPDAKLAELRAALSDPVVMISQNVGLVNLASRLKLLYNGSARIELSCERNPRCTTVRMLIPLEVLRNV